MKKGILFAAVISCLAASAAQAVCPAKSSDAVRPTDLVTLELQATMGSRQALEDAGKSTRKKGTVVYDRVANVRQYCNGSEWVSMEAGGAAPAPDPGGTASCASKTVWWGGGCSATADSRSHGQSVTVSKSTQRDPTACQWRYGGSATYTCNDGVFQLTGGGSCERFWTGCR